MVDKPPTLDPLLQTQVRPWELKEHRPNQTMSRAAYKPYNTYVGRLSVFETERLIDSVVSSQNFLLGLQLSRRDNDEGAGVGIIEG